MIEFINARTGEVLTTKDDDGIVMSLSKKHPNSPALAAWKSSQQSYAAMLARESNDDVYIRWEAGAGREGEPDTLITLEEAMNAR